jgi:hypothetical protein
MEETWSVPDVYLLTEADHSEVAIPHLTLTFSESVLALDKADGEPVWHSDRGGLAELSPVERSVLPDGRDGVVIAVVERDGRQRHRFVLATDDALATETAVRDPAAAHGGRSRSARRAVWRLVTVGIVVAALAALTLRCSRQRTSSTSGWRQAPRPARLP